MAEYMYGNNDQSDYWNKLQLSDKYKEIGETMLHYWLVFLQTATLNSDLYYEATAAVDAKDPNKAVTSIGKGQVVQLLGFMDKGDQQFWGMWKLRYGPDSGCGVARVPQDNNGFMYDEFYGPVGPVYTEKFSTMKKMEQQFITSVIMGAATVYDFEAFVDQWNNAGGNDLTKEINDWYQQNK
jgi:putative aldouronate transport system substrate-binding protein